MTHTCEEIEALVRLMGFGLMHRAGETNMHHAGETNMHHVYITTPITLAGWAHTVDTTIIVAENHGTRERAYDVAWKKLQQYLRDNPAP